MRDKPNVLLIRNCSFFGGAEVYLLNLAKGLRRKNIQPTLWTNNKKFILQAEKIGIKSQKKYLGPIIKNEINFLFFIIGYCFLFVYYSAVIFGLKMKKQIDVIHLESLNDFLLFTWIGKIFKIKVIWTFDVAFYAKRNKLLVYWLSLVSQKADRIIAISEFMKRNIISIGVDSKQVALIYHGIEIKESLSSANSFNKESMKIGFVGKVSREKGIFIFLEAAKKILRKYNNIEFWIIGKIDDNSELVTKYSDRKIIFKGWQDDLDFVYKNIDIVVTPSLVEESFGLVAAEAMGYGKAVIVSDRGALPELVEHKKSGMVVCVENSDSLTEALFDLIENPSKIETLQKNAFLRAKNMFTDERMTNETINIYNLK